MHELAAFCGCFALLAVTRNFSFARLKNNKIFWQSEPCVDLGCTLFNQFVILHATNFWAYISFNYGHRDYLSESGIRFGNWLRVVERDAVPDHRDNAANTSVAVFPLGGETLSAVQPVSQFLYVVCVLAQDTAI